MTTQTDALAAGITELAEAVRAACNDPADAIRLLSALAVYAPVVQPGSAPIGVSIATTANETAALCRRAALTSLARACAAYQPASYDDAATVRDAVADLIDGEAETAADAGDTGAYLALRALRTAVVEDLTVRGGQLPRLVTVTRRTSLPALLLAQQLYADAARADDLVARVDPVHPAFMPVGFTALGR